MEKTPEINSQNESINFHEVSSQRKELRRALKELMDKQTAESSNKNEKRELNSRLKSFDKRAANFKVENYGGLNGAIEHLTKSKDKAEQEFLPVDLEVIYAEFPEYQKIEEDQQYLDQLKDKRMKQIFASTRAKTEGEKKSAEMHLDDTLNMIEETEKDLEKVPAIDLHAAELVNYKQDLAESGHIAMVLSTKENLDAIGDKMLSGKPMFLFGLTGTGKTTLAQYAAKHYTGKDAEMVYCSPQTKETDVWGRTGITKEDDVPVTKFIYGPLARAMQEGRVIIFDEFTNLPDEQISFIKGVFSKKTGDTVSVQGNGEISLAEGFQMIFTANLKSEKNPNKKALPAEMADEFTQNNLEINYSPKEDAYDIILARLMNRDGSIDMSNHDLNTVLPNLCLAMADIQESYVRGTSKEMAGRVGALGANGKAYSFEKFVTTQRSIEAILSLWNIEKQKGKNTTTFSEFLDDRLKTALNFKEFPERDRILAAQIFASWGFLITLDPKELNISNPEDIFKLNAIKAMRGEEAKEEIIKKSGDVKHLSLREVANLDPFERRAKEVVAEGEALLGDTEKAKDKFLSGIQKRSKKIFGKKSKEESEFTPESITEISAFTSDAFGKGKFNEATITPPTEIDYTTLKNTPDASKYGEYTLNPEMGGVDYENAKIFIPDLSAMNGKELDEVFKHVVDTYGDKYHIPGLEYWKYIIENPSKADPAIKDGKYYFFPGSVLRYSGGNACVPYSYWLGSRFDRDADHLGLQWGGDYRVLLLEK
ncbi:MAG: AAA family ATPase [bacterium]